MPTTLLVLGAGASWPLPQTGQLTNELVERANTDGFLVYRAVRNLLPGCQTFEDIMAALWDVSTALRREQALPTWAAALDGMLPPGSRLADVVLNGLIDAAHYVTIRLVQASAQGSTSSQAKLASCIGRGGRLVVATLNYDDTVLSEAGNLYDGFAHGVGTSEFDRRFALRVRQTRTTLLWLHGSVHFNIHAPYPNPDPRSGAIFWDDNATAATQTWSGAVRNDMYDLPIVVGTDKPRQILRRPFVQYWSALSDVAPDIDRLVVVGYGGSDEHLNHVLQNILMWRGNDLKLIICTKVQDWDEALASLWRAFPSVFNAYTPRRTATPGNSLQPVVSPPPTVNLPEVWVDPDGVEDLVLPSTLRRLRSVLYGTGGTQP